MTALERWFPGLIGIAVFGIPTALILVHAFLSWSARRWPTASGRITRSRVVRRQRGGADLDVRYQYEVGGTTYEGKRVRFGAAFNRITRDVERTRDMYPLGLPVQVRYHPTRPRWSTLEARASRALWLWAAFGLFMVGAIGGALIGWWE